MKTTMLILIAGVFCVSPAVAQEKPPTEGAGEVVQQWIQILASASQDGEAPKIQYFYTTTNGVAGDFVMIGGPGMGGFGAPDAFSLVNNKLQDCFSRYSSGKLSCGISCLTPRYILLENDFNCSE